METHVERNRRKFSRIAFQSEASLFLPDGEYGVEVLDLSLQGALIHPNANMFVNVGTHGTLKIRLDALGTTWPTTMAWLVVKLIWTVLLTCGVWLS